MGHPGHDQPFTGASALRAGGKDLRQFGCSCSRWPWLWAPGSPSPAATCAPHSGRTPLAALPQPRSASNVLPGPALHCSPSV